MWSLDDNTCLSSDTEKMRARARMMLEQGQIPDDEDALDEAPSFEVALALAAD